MADIRNIKILGTVEASTNSSIILTGSNTLIKKVLDDGRVLFEVNDTQVVVSGNLMLSSSGAFNSVLTSSNGMYNLDTALHAIDQTIQDKGAEIRSAYEAVRFRHFGTLGPMGLTRLNLTQLATSGSDYFASTNIKDITVDLLIDTNNDGNYRNDMASIVLFASGSSLYADIDAPSAAGNPFRFIAVNETLLDVINTRASYNVPSSGDGITAQEISASFVQTSDVNNALASYATLSGVSSSFVDLSTNQTILGTKTFNVVTASDLYASTSLNTGLRNVWSKPQVGSITSLTASSNNITIDLSLTNNFTFLCAASSTSYTLSAPLNPTAGQSGIIIITQGSSGASTLSYNTFWKFPNGMDKTLSTGLNSICAIAYYLPTSGYAICSILKDIA